MTTARINQHTPHSTTAGVAAVILLCIAAIVAIAMHAPSGYAAPTPSTVHTPSQEALLALGDVARADAERIVSGKLSIVRELSAQAVERPELIYNPAWRGQWQGAWLAINVNSTGELQAAAARCVAATLTTRSLDLLGCTRNAAATINR